MCTVLKHAILDIIVNGEKTLCKNSACFSSPTASLFGHFGFGTEAGLTRRNCIGPDALELFEGFQFTEGEHPKDLKTVINTFAEFCIGKTDETYERYCFNKHDQEPSETIGACVTALRRLVKTCNYGQLEESLIRDRIVIGIRDNNNRKKLLVNSKLTLGTCIDTCRGNEKTTMQMKEINQDEVQVVKKKVKPIP